MEAPCPSPPDFSFKFPYGGGRTDQFTTIFANLPRISDIMLHLSVVFCSKFPEMKVSTNLTYKLQLDDDLLDGGLHPVAPLRDVATFIMWQDLPHTSFLCLVLQLLV